MGGVCAILLVFILPITAKRIQEGRVGKKAPHSRGGRIDGVRHYVYGSLYSVLKVLACAGVYIYNFFAF